jgi:hypothetical protein
MGTNTVGAKRFTLQFVCDNDSFGATEEERNEEIARILREVSSRILVGGEFRQHKNVCDANGNIVGTFVLKEER